MFVEFFCRARWQTLLVAWGGLIGVLGYSVFLAWVKSSINTFYSEFYDTLQMAGSIALGSDSEGSGSDGAYSADAGSGLFAPAAPSAPPAPPSATGSSSKARLRPSPGAPIVRLRCSWC